MKLNLFSCFVRCSSLFISSEVGVENGRRPSNALLPTGNIFGILFWDSRVTYKVVFANGWFTAHGDQPLQHLKVTLQITTNLICSEVKYL